MSIDSIHDINGLKTIGAIVRDCLLMLIDRAEAGMSTAELDHLARKFLDKHKAASAPMRDYNFPGSVCISINEEIAHGIPGNRIIKPGDLINIDVSAEKNGYYGDTGQSFLLKSEATDPKNKKLAQLIEVNRLARDKAIAQSTAGASLGLLGKTMEDVALQHGFTVIRNLGSHGVGRKLHEEPKFIPGYWAPKDKRKLKKGQVITLEPFSSTGAELAEDGTDGWTLLTSPKYRTAQCEHTIIITDAEPIITTA